ncbi:amidohydrolase [Actinoplanes sp. ATCC 53533]|uniref:amidohydrolase n=1 Tax=Actinoplanes sp. ATCC 53533 TaxID=1288362 RepID=UPI000F7B9764|nr:amidohydrolase [Actinoplanes sp. ATCC 53533]RSM65516.1 amidohydrolase [Actinoplanes sp. ATCC 53533]
MTLSPSHRDSPTTVFRNGRVFTAAASRAWASAVAVQDGRIVAVGDQDAVAPYLSRADEVVDLDGRAMLPGFLDAHAHPVNGGLERARCDLTGARTAAACQELTAAYAARHPDREWILGGGWSMESFPGGRPDRRQLDQVVPGRPAFLPNRDHHSAWVNSAALARAGIDAGTPDPADGRIERDPDGAPTGLLHEGAMDLITPVLPRDTQAEFDEGLRVAQRYLHSLGIVGWQDALVRVDGAAGEPSVHAAYLRAQREGWLTARVSGALWWDRACPAGDIEAQVARLTEVRRQVTAEGPANGSRYRVHSIKVMQDGVLETFTAALLEPYLDHCGHPTDNHGISFLDPDTLRRATVALDAAGFDVHFHSLGDRAVRDVLDAIEAARTANGASGGRHLLAHLQVVAPPDIGRFRRLGAAANLQPLWACHEPQMDELAIPFLGPARSAWQYPFSDLHRDGATIVMGSDWPVSSPDPIAGIHVAVNRLADGAPPGTEPLDARQALPLPVAVAAYTAGSAWANRVEHLSGSLRTGLRGDLVVLDRDPFDGPSDHIARARVARTYVDGHLVHRSD